MYCVLSEIITISKTMMEIPKSPYTLEMFSPLIGTTFKAELGNNTVIDLTLCEAEATVLHKRDGRLFSKSGQVRTDPFSLVFLYESLLPQGTYTLHNETLGEISIFLVPIGPFDGAWGHEAVFN